MLPITRIASWLIPILAIAAVCRPALGADDTAPAPTRVLVYDIRDLTWSLRHYPLNSPLVPPNQIGEPRPGKTMVQARPGGGGGGGRAGNQPADGAPGISSGKSNEAEQIVVLLKETVDPESWVDNGGKNGAIKLLNGMAIVQQTEKNHASIEAILKQLRAATCKMVRIRAHWLLLQPAELETILKKPEAGKPAGILQEVDLSALAKSEQKGTAFRGQTTCFNGQTVHIASGRTRNVIYDLEAVCGQGTQAYNPIADIVRSGIVLQVTPLIASDNATIAVDVQSVYSEWLPAMAEARFAGAGERDATTSASLVDRANMIVHEFKTSLNLPAGKAVLVSGSSLDPAAAGGRAEQLYLVLEVTASN